MISVSKSIWVQDALHLVRVDDAVVAILRDITTFRKDKDTGEEKPHFGITVVRNDDGYVTLEYRNDVEARDAMCRQLADAVRSLEQD